MKKQVDNDNGVSGHYGARQIIKLLCFNKKNIHKLLLYVSFEFWLISVVPENAVLSVQSADSSGFWTRCKYKYNINVNI